MALLRVDPKTSAPLNPMVLTVCARDPNTNSVFVDLVWKLHACVVEGEGENSEPKLAVYIVGGQVTSHRHKLVRGESRQLQEA